MKTGCICALVMCLAAALTGHGPATAQPAPPRGDTPQGTDLSAGAEGERPWAKGVSAESQEQALRLFREANIMLKDSLFVLAAAKYREALSHWDHPAIHYNLALALLNLDQPLEVYHSLEKAMAYGPAPLDDEKFDHARSYKMLIEKQLARVEITCEIQGARVSLDGKEVLVGPGTWEGLLRAGDHAITARAPGYVETSLSRSLPAGEVTHVPVRLYTEVELTRYRRNWDVWKPWAVTGGGALMLAAGAALHLKARSDYEGFDQGIRDCGGCVPEIGLLERKTRAGTYQGLAAVTYGISGAALITGLTLVYVNRARPYRLQVDEFEREQELLVAPVIGPGEAGFVAAFRF